MNTTFNTMAVLPISNHGGYEIELSADGYMARVRYNIGYGTTKPKWQLIKYDTAGEPYVTHHRKRLHLSNFMRVN